MLDKKIELREEAIQNLISWIPHIDKVICDLEIASKNLSDMKSQLEKVIDQCTAIIKDEKNYGFPPDNNLIQNIESIRDSLCDMLGKI